MDRRPYHSNRPHSHRPPIPSQPADNSQIIASITGDLLSYDPTLDAEADFFNDATFGAQASSEPWVPSPLPPSIRTRPNHHRPPPTGRTTAPSVLPYDPAASSLLAGPTPVLPPFRSSPALQLAPAFARVSGRPIAPFTAAQRRKVLAGTATTVATSADVDPEASASSKPAEMLHPGLMTERDKEAIMKIHLTQISASGARAVQDWRGTFKFRSAPTQSTVDTTGVGGGKRLYASVHHPRRNFEAPCGEQQTAPTSGALDAMLAVEKVLGWLLEVERVDEWIGSLHPLAVEQVGVSIGDRTELLRMGVTEVLNGGGVLGKVVEIKKGRKAIARMMKALVEGIRVDSATSAELGVGATGWSLGVKMRRAGCSGREFWELLDKLMAGYLGEAKEPVEGLVGACEVLVNEEECGKSGETKKLVGSLDRRAVGRFLLVHPRGLGLLRALLPWVNEEEVVEGICEVAEEVHRRLPGGQKPDDLWNLLIALLSKTSQQQTAEILNSRLGKFLADNIQGFA